MSYNNLSAEELNREQLTDNITFMNDASQFLADREDYSSDNPDDIYDRYLEHFRYQNVNEVSAMRDLYLAQDYQNKGDQEGLERMNRLMSTFEKQNGEYNLETVTDYLGGIITAPSTIGSMFSFGATKAGAVAAQQGIKFGIKEIIKSGVKAKGKSHVSKKAVDKGTEELGKFQTAKNAFLGGGYRTAIGSGVIEGGGAFGTTAAQETTRVATGQKAEEDFSYGNVALATALGTVPGTLIGGAVGTRKALVSNVAEDVVMKEVAKRTTQTKKAYKKHTIKTFASKGNVGKFAKDTESKLKLSLKETANDKIVKGEEIKLKLKGTKQENLAITLEDMVVQNIASAAATIIDKVGVRSLTKEQITEGTKIFKEKGAKAKGAINPKDIKDGKIIKGSAEDLKERITSRVGRGLSDSSKLTEKEFGGILKAHGLNADEFSSLYVSDVSTAGRTLGIAGRIEKTLKKTLFEELDELDKGILTLGTATEAARKKADEILDRRIKKLGINVNLNGVSDFIRKLNKTRIGLMTIQTATTVRNTTNGLMRNYVYALDNLGEAGAKYAYGKYLNASSDKAVQEIGKDAVRAAKGQRQVGFKSLVLNDMVAGITSQETAILVRMFQDTQLGKSDLAKQLFREMGDVGVAGTDNGLMVGAARKLNILNTYSDNIFKKAIFSRELDKIVRADVTGIFRKEGVTDLKDLILKKKKLTMLDDKSIATAMEKALDFTYQTGKFRGKEGQFNQLAASFIDIASGTFGSTFVPFPRYLVNQFRFFYEHAPIVGLYDFAGILNKSDMTERIGKNVTGLSMLGAFYGMRSHFGDENTGAFEYKNPYGHGTFDARASLGPFTAFAWFADLLYTNGGPKGASFMPRLHDNDKVLPSLNTRELMEAFTGGFGRSGTGLMVVDRAAQMAIEGTADGKLQQRAYEGITKFVGNYLSTFTVVAGMLKDTYAALDPEYRLLTDNTDVEFIPYMLKQATRAFPFETHADGDGFFERPAQTTATRTTGIENTLPLFRQFTGLTPVQEKNDVEKEFARMNLDYYEYTPRKTTDADINRDARQRMAFIVESRLKDFINGSVYNSKYYENNPALKRKALLSVISSAKREAREDALAFNEKYDTEEMIEKKAKAQFFNLSDVDRSVLMKEWKDRHPGEDFDDTEPYNELLFLNQKLKEFDVTTGLKKPKYQSIGSKF